MLRGGTTVPDEDRAELRRQPPPALPDGSLPVYPSHPLPGTPGGGPPLPAFGWGPDFADDPEPEVPEQYGDQPKRQKQLERGERTGQRDHPEQPGTTPASRRRFGPIIGRLTIFSGARARLHRAE